MYKLIKVESSSPIAMTEDLLGDEAALRWLEIAEAVEERGACPGLEYALTAGNKLYLVVRDEEDVNPLKFIIRGEVSRRYDVTPSIEVIKFEKPLPLILSLLDIGKLMVSMTAQLSQQFPDLLDPYHVSLTGASLDFLEETRRIYWNGTSHLPALSPLARYVAEEEYYEFFQEGP